MCSGLGSEEEQHGKAHKVEHEWDMRGDWPADEPAVPENRIHVEVDLTGEGGQ